MTTPYINLGATSFPQLSIKKVEEIKNAKFICELSVMGKFGWTDSPAQIYYQEKPAIGHSQYFGLIYQQTAAGRHLFIIDGMSAVGIPIEGVMTKAGEIIFSRFHHDYRSADTAEVSVDGGLSYTRVIGDINNVTRVVLTIKNGELVLVNDEAEIQELQNEKARRDKRS